MRENVDQHSETASVTGHVGGSLLQMQHLSGRGNACAKSTNFNHKEASAGQLNNQATVTKCV